VTADHPSIETIADHLAALLPPEQQASVAAHLSDCADCTAAAEAVDDVSRLLAQTGAETVPMPAGVAAELDEALRSAGEQRAAHEAVGQGATVVPLGRCAPAETPRRSRRSWPLLVAAAAAVVAVGTVVISDLDLSPGGSADSSVARDALTNPASAGGASAGGASAGGASADPAQGAGAPASAAESELNSDNETDSSAAPARPRLTRLSPASLPRYAAGLTRASTQDVPVSRRCAPAPAPAGDVISTVRWKGAPATVVVDAEARQAAVLDCETASTVLFRTGY